MIIKISYMYYFFYLISKFYLFISAVRWQQLHTHSAHGSWRVHFLALHYLRHADDHEAPERRRVHRGRHQLVR